MWNEQDTINWGQLTWGPVRQVSVRHALNSTSVEPANMIWNFADDFQIEKNGWSRSYVNIPCHISS